eukprot:699040_1
MEQYCEYMFQEALIAEPDKWELQAKWDDILCSFDYFIRIQKQTGNCAIFMDRVLDWSDMWMHLHDRTLKLWIYCSSYRMLNWRNSVLQWDTWYVKIKNAIEAYFVAKSHAH